MTAEVLQSAAERLNRSCFCITLDRGKLHAAMEREAGDPGFSSSHILPREHLFSNVPVFLAARDLDRMSAVVRAAEAAAELPGYREAAFGWAPAIARFDPGPDGVFMGYDFHLGPDGPKLIEINTNAGGAFLNALLANAQRACCPEVEHAFKLPLVADFDQELVRMFQAEWASQRAGQTLRSIAIVDDDPASQYLYPEFLLAREALRRHGIETVIADAGALRFERGRLWAGAVPVDLVYNRLVDFALERPEHGALRAAYLVGAVVVTPNPHNHALLADKRNLTLLSDRAALMRFGLAADLADQADRVPRTVLVTQDNAGELWETRRHFFFKPATGHGAKAVYRGDKLTRGVWQRVVAGGYVAQGAVPPGERMIEVGDAREPRKSDIRLYTYRGRVLLAAARLYQGQTTNFRTPGGGFAPVFFF
jgi:glutathione synthase/RimK-type ligase-like ATP-grasp enzyme